MFFKTLQSTEVTRKPNEILQVFEFDTVDDPPKTQTSIVMKHYQNISNQQNASLGHLRNSELI